MLRIEIFNDIEKVQVYWQFIQKMNPTYIFQTYDWVKVWHDTIGVASKKLNHLQMQFVVVFDEKSYGKSDEARNGKSNEPVLILPLEKNSARFICKYDLFDSIVFDYFNPIANWEYFENLENVEELVELLSKELPKVDALEFISLPDKIYKTKNPFVEYAGRRGRYRCGCGRLRKSETRAYSLTPSGPWEEYQKENIRSNIKTNTIKRIRQLKALGNLSFNILTDKSEIDKFLNILFEQKSKQYIRTQREDIFAKEEYRNFYLEITRRCFANDGENAPSIQISYLTLDEKVIAIHWGGYFKRRFYYLMPSYDGESEFYKYAPGRVLMYYLFDWAFNNKIDTFDFTVGGEDYKKTWSNDVISYYSLFIPANIKGKLFYGVRELKRKILAGRGRGLRNQDNQVGGSRGE
ncbi:MAG: GNAT family N-acetyltransferase [Oligoflexia bacterium]|nr:GNAT family N-acetyltransferase [Oligoflexia bacterium]